ncbi:TP901 family phage tail tape measure protein [Kitasatospora sp. MAA4]|uniref:phage tail tape measure protein n=1 Tax=Kitasatospora sp. MAA4 TaxID=3035093 RepID=UPI002476022F|nr:phage tail tape measure protein [Kitasatospora sp. MAA4]MDH6134662.1 TP901 family phage tail tape measure protein [Kitasatospora sp. MAA4]
MSTTDLVFRLLALNEASAVFKEVQASAAETATAVSASNAEMSASAEKAAAEQSAAAEEGASKGLAGASPALLGVAAAAAVVGAKCVEMAGHFESSVATLQTGAGESAANMKMVSSGILDMAPQVATTTDQLVSGMYMVESAGYHGADGLTVLHAAAEGAKVGAADLGTVGNALTDVLNDYHLPASQAVAVTDQLVTTVSSGKTTMEELGSSLSNVVPLASSAHIEFSQVAGALATMTGHGMSAQQASQDLGNTIRSLQAPNAVAAAEMRQMGLDSTQVSQQLGTKGLTGTLSELTSAITAHMGPAGTVIQSAFNNSTAAAANAKTMMASMPPELQKMAQGLLDGSESSKQWTAGIKALDPVQKGLMTQFEGVAKQTHEFNSMLTSGGPAAQTYNAALEKMTGGATGLTTSLMLTGENAGTFEANVKAIGAAGQNAGKDVTGWSEVTNTLSFKLDQAKAVVETLGIRIGMILMPVVKDAVGGFTDLAQGALAAGSWLERHKQVAESLGIGIAAVLLPSLWGVVAALGAAAVEAAIAAAPFIAAAAVVALLAYGFMQLVGHWKDVEHVFAEGFAWIGDHWKMLVSIFLPGIGLLTAGIAFLVDHWKQVQHDLGAVWTFIEHAFEDEFVDPAKDALHDVVGFFDVQFEAWRYLFTQEIPGWWRSGVGFFEHDFVDPVKGAVHDVSGFFDTEFDAWRYLFTQEIPGWWRSGVAFFEHDFVDPVMNSVHLVENGFSSVFGALSGDVERGFGAVVGAVRPPVNSVIGLVDRAIDGLDSVHVSIPSWVPEFGGKSFGVNIPKIPMLAAGGMVMPQPGGTTVTVAEAGQPEIVTPLPAMQQAMAAALATAGTTAQAGAGSSPDRPLYLQLELKLNGQTIDKQLVQFLKSGGRLQSVAMATA